MPKFKGRVVEATEKEYEGSPWGNLVIRSEAFDNRLVKAKVDVKKVSDLQRFLDKDVSVEVSLYLANGNLIVKVVSVEVL